MTKININKENNQGLMVRFISSTEIELNKLVNELDKFVFNFLEILEKYSDYVIVSGYVSILLGRTRTTEDIDILIPRLEESKLKLLFNDLLLNGLWCINSDDFKDIYDILNENDSIRIAVKDQINPNIELKFIHTKLQEETLKKSIVVLYSNRKIKISNLEMQIAYKRAALKSDKDYLDADHLLELFKDNINHNLIHYYTERIKNEA